MTRHAIPRRAFTLLEVVLAISLTAVIVGLIAGAIDFHLRQLNVRRSNVDEAQVARTILRQIADDLRSVVVDHPLDLSGLQSAAATAATSAASAATSGAATGTSATNSSSSGTSGAGATSVTSGTPSSSTSSSGTTSSATGTSTSGSSSDASGEESASTAVTPPGIYGTSYELQIDVSRVPRYEEYAVLDADAQSGMTRLLSDVKTVSYYVVDSRSIPGNPTVGNLPINTGSGGGGQRGRSNNSYGINGSLGLPPDTLLSGLARRVNDRAAWRYAVDRGEDTETNQQAELIAPEVAYVEFSYHDGSQWVSEWDTQQMGGVPMAVEINLFLGTQEQANSQALNAGRRRIADADATNVSPSISYDPDHWYRLVVNLPSADADALTSASSDSSSSTSGSTTNSTSTGGTQ